MTRSKEYGQCLQVKDSQQGSVLVLVLFTLFSDLKLGVTPNYSG